MWSGYETRAGQGYILAKLATKRVFNSHQTFFLIRGSNLGTGYSNTGIVLGEDPSYYNIIEVYWKTLFWGAKSSV